MDPLELISNAGPGPALLERMQRAAGQMNLSAKVRRKASRLWAVLVARIFETLPLFCTGCGAPMRMIAFITDP